MSGLHEKSVGEVAQAALAEFRAAHKAHWQDHLEDIPTGLDTGGGDPHGSPEPGWYDAMISHGHPKQQATDSNPVGT